MTNLDYVYDLEPMSYVSGELCVLSIESVMAHAVSN